MPRRNCPNCGRRLPYAARRCVHCNGISLEGPLGTERPVWERVRTGVAVLLLTGMVGGGLVYRNADSLAYWYADFAARHLPSSMSAFAPRETDAGAFFYCARQVAKRMDGEYSVETFPSLEQSRAVELGEGRYEIHSFVDEARENGDRVRHLFVCTVQYARGRWVLEELDLRADLAATAEDAPRLGMRPE